MKLDTGEIYHSEAAASFVVTETLTTANCL